MPSVTEMLGLDDVELDQLIDGLQKEDAVRQQDHSHEHMSYSLVRHDPCGPVFRVYRDGHSEIAPEKEQE